jgi:hypothetical protein
MVRGAITRWVTAVGVMAVAVALAIGSVPTAAGAAPKPAPKPTAINIVGKNVSGKIVVQRHDQPRLFAALLDEVGWLATAKPQTAAPKADKLGPKYTVTVLIKNTPTQVYDLYPLAAGGPRAHRSARQPTGKKTTDGWFYGRLTMSESLRVSGVPLKAKQDVVNGGIGGGVGQDINVDELDPVEGVNQFLDQMRRLFLLNGAVLMVILIGLAGIAFTIRRRV